MIYKVFVIRIGIVNIASVHVAKLEKRWVIHFGIQNYFSNKSVPNSEQVLKKSVTSQKRPKYTVTSAPIKRYMGFDDTFKPPTLSFLLQFKNYEFFILKQCID